MKIAHPEHLQQECNVRLSKRTIVVLWTLFHHGVPFLTIFMQYYSPPCCKLANR